MALPGPEDAARQSDSALLALVNGYQVSQALHVAATLGLADVLQDGPRTCDELAGAAGSHAPSLRRLLRALAGVGVFREEHDGRYALTELGQGLRQDAPDSVAGWAALVGRAPHWQAWGALLHSVRTGENAFRAVHGVDVFEYRARNPREAAVFDQAMTTLTHRHNRQLLDAYDFGRFHSVIDVGGGQGAFLAALLSAHSNLRGVLFDLPRVVAGAGPVLETAGVVSRCRIVSGSFFDSVPEGADAYVLKAILHNWEDREAAQILRRCRHATPAGGALLVIERELGGRNDNPGGKFSDLNMLATAGGRERTLEEYTALFTAAGYEYVQTRSTVTGLSIIEATVT